LAAAQLAVHLSKSANIDKTQSRAVSCLYFSTKLVIRKEEAATLQDRPGWFPIATAPFERDLQLSVIEKGEVYCLVFSCRRTQSGWVDSASKRAVLVDPTHWREWSD
jgi:hypothetical protein